MCNAIKRNQGIHEHKKPSIKYYTLLESYTEQLEETVYVSINAVPLSKVYTTYIAKGLKSLVQSIDVFSYSNMMGALYKVRVVYLLTDK